jgi:SET domain-containing protein
MRYSNIRQKLQLENMHFSWFSPKLILKKSPVSGKGVFTNSQIKKDETILVWGGYIISEDLVNPICERIGDHTVQVEDNLYLVALAKNKPDLGDFINHSCEPNAGVRGQISIVAMRDIKVGEEIFLDYATVTTEPGYSFRCNCGSPNCRNLITGDDWKQKDLQEKYNVYFSSYIADKIRKLNLR